MSGNTAQTPPSPSVMLLIMILLLPGHQTIGRSASPHEACSQLGKDDSIPVPRYPALPLTWSTILAAVQGPRRPVTVPFEWLAPDTSRGTYDQYQGHTRDRTWVWFAIHASRCLYVRAGVTPHAGDVRGLLVA